MPNYEFSGYPQRIEKSILIHAPLSTVWKYLTVPELMQQWMGDPEMNIEILTDWKVSASFIVKGFHHVQFENKGTILQLEPECIFQYSHLSSFSDLPDKAENYTVITFRLNDTGGQTELSVETENFPTEAIFRHWEFYWNGTTQLLKSRIETNP